MIKIYSISNDAHLHARAHTPTQRTWQQTRFSTVIILSGRQNHNQVLLKTCSSISKKPMQGKDQDQVWAGMPGWVVYGAN